MTKIASLCSPRQHGCSWPWAGSSSLCTLQRVWSPCHSTWRNGLEARESRCTCQSCLSSFTSSPRFRWVWLQVASYHGHHAELIDGGEGWKEGRGEKGVGEGDTMKGLWMEWRIKERKDGSTWLQRHLHPEVGKSHLNRKCFKWILIFHTMNYQARVHSIMFPLTDTSLDNSLLIT